MRPASHRPLGDTPVLVDEALTRRVRALTHRLGRNGAQRALGVSDATFAAARDRGRLKTETRDRIVATLDRLENATKGEAAE